MSGDQPAVALQFNDVSVAFEGERVLKNISFEVPSGETRVIFGAAGAGKTVTLKAAIGLVRPEAGQVILLGQDLQSMSEEEMFDLRPKVGMLFQEGALFDSMTIEENVAYPLVNQKHDVPPPAEVNRRVREALRFVELEDTLQKYPSELSGGMRRRVAIARAVVTEPPLLLYDSPTAGLDPITANTICKLILKQRDLSNTTTLMVTHRYQNGNLMANYRYDKESGDLVPAGRSHRGAVRTKFLGFRDGSLIFEGTQDELEASRDPYVTKFVKHNG
jgi:phospholipid/cholesterol/gamma-HCH transport system ATP-binding protein